jgi:hypothetical protein
MESVIRRSIIEVEGFGSIHNLSNAWHVHKGVVNLMYGTGDNVLDGQHENSLMSPARDPFRGLSNRCACCNTTFLTEEGQTCDAFINSRTPDLSDHHDSDTLASNKQHRRRAGSSSSGANKREYAYLTALQAEELERCKDDSMDLCCKAYEWCSQCAQCGGSIPVNLAGHTYDNLPDVCHDLSLRALQEGLFNLHHTIYGIYDETGGYIFDYFKHIGPFVLKQKRHASVKCRSTHDFYPNCLGTAENKETIDLDSLDHHSDHVMTNLKEALLNERLNHAFQYDGLFEAFVFEGDTGVFSYPLEVVACQLSMLQEGEWASRQTSDLELSFFLYNGNTDVYAFVDFRTHFALSGLVESHLLVKAIAARNMYSSTQDCVRGFLEAVVVCGVLLDAYVYAKYLLEKLQRNYRDTGKVHPPAGAGDDYVSNSRKQSWTLKLKPSPGKGGYLLTDLSFIICSFAQIVCWAALVDATQSFRPPPLETSRMEHHWIILESVSNV